MYDRSTLNPYFNLCIFVGETTIPGHENALPA